MHRLLALLLSSPIVKKKTKKTPQNLIFASNVHFLKLNRLSQAKAFKLTHPEEYFCTCFVTGLDEIPREEN